MNNLKTYVPSGNWNKISILYLLLTMFIITPILSLVYTFLLYIVPVIYVKFLLTIGFGFLLGYIISNFIVKLGRVRNNKVALLFSFLVFLAAYYFYCCAWVYVMTLAATDPAQEGGISYITSNFDFLSFVNITLNPSLVFSTIRLLGSIGTWGIKSSTISGGLLYVIWLIEFVMLALSSIFIGSGQSSLPFCETSQQWFNLSKFKNLGFVPNGKELLNQLSNNQVDMLLELPKNVAEDGHKSKIDIWHSENNSEYYLSVTNERASIGDKGKVEHEDLPLCETIRISYDNGTKLLNHFA